MTLLKVEGIRKGFPGVQALDGVDFELDRGEVLALMGENGAGKSTLMKILSGIYSRDEGQILLDGQPLVARSPKDAQEAGISIIHQEMNLCPHLTVAQNIYLGREPRAGVVCHDATLNKEAVALLQRTHIDLDPRAVVEELTVAKQQMVEIAKALSFESTKVLIMDEPTSALSAAETMVLFTLIRDLRSKGVGIVYISHRMEELRTIADRVTVLRDGKYIGTRTMAEADEREIIAMMVGRDLTGHTRPEGRRQVGHTEPSLEVSGLSTKRLLRDISFDVYPGEILGFAGLMGAGRTEVARAVIGADPKQSGVIKVGGREVSIHHPADAVKYGVGYLSEDRKRHGLMLERHVDFNILLAAMQRFTKWGVVQTAPGRGVSRDYVKRLRIKTPNISTPVKNLSGGNQQKVVVAKWLARNCDVLIFDEPTRGIDVGAKEEIYQLLNDLIAEGKSVVVISSDLAEVLRVCDRILVMSQGRITGELTNAEADQENIMELATKSMRQEVHS